MARTGTTYVILLAILGLTGCGGGQPDVPQSTGESAAPAERATTQTPGRDLATTDVCALIPGQTVAELLGGTLARQPSGAAYGDVSTDCSYAVDVDGLPKVVLVFLYPPDHFEMYREMEENPQPVEGLGDRAYATVSAEMHELHVLEEGNVTIDVRAESPDDARRLAELVLSRL
jgi:hypothetical protein